jgi:hypothetical protein
MNYEVSLSVSDARQGTTTARCEIIHLPVNGAAQLPAEQVRRVQAACLATVCTAAGLNRGDPPSHLPATNGVPTLRQLVRLYRAAARAVSFDLPQLQRLSDRLYQKQLENLSTLEVSGLISTLNASAKGTLDLEQILAPTILTTDGRVGQADA